MNTNWVWITWETQRRNTALSRALGAKLFQFDLKLNRWLRYPVALFKTVLAFVVERPSLIFVQNPSLLLAFFSVCYGKIVHLPIVVDAHNAGLFPFSGSQIWLNRVALFIIKNASVTIVTNENLRRYVERRGGRAFVLPDLIPDFHGDRTKNILKGKFNILFICTYAPDEPYIEVIKAATALDRSIFIYITGNSSGKEKEFKNILPPNVVITGYLKEEDYIQLLHSADIIMDLTDREDCLVCGAYEALSAEKPMILSDKKALKTYFSKGAVYVDNTAKDMAMKIVKSIASLEGLKKEVLELKQEKAKSGEKQIALFRQLLKNLEGNIPSSYPPE